MKLELLIPIILIVILSAGLYDVMQRVKTRDEFAKVCAEAGGKTVFNGRNNECIK
jgi:hypothetical protein